MFWGCIDGNHVRIQALSEGHENDHVNRMKKSEKKIMSSVCQEQKESEAGGGVSDSEWCITNTD